MLETAPAATCGPRENSPAKGTGTTEPEAGAAELGGGGGSEGRGVGGAQRSWDWSNDAWGTEVGETAEDGGDVAHGNCGSAKPTGTPCHSRITPLEGEHLIDEAAQATTCGADDYGERGGPTDSDVVLAASSSTPRPAERELITAKSPSEEGTADAAGGDKSEPAAEAAGDRAEREEKMCRICFGGPDDEATCGKLISPCKCRGTMRFVHLGCLNSWRRSSGKHSSFFQCDQCHYKYSFSRTTYARWATNECVILFTSLLVFLVVVVLSGYMMKLLFYFFPSWFTHSTLDMADKLHGEGLGAFPADDVVDEDLDEYWELVQLLHSASSSLSSFSVDALHMALGFVLVGMLGFLQIMLAIFAHGGGIFWNGAGGRDREGLGIGILVAVIVVGGLRALWDIYKLVRWFARSGLERLEEVILEVHN